MARGGGGCPANLAGRLALVPLGSFDRLAETLPPGCVVLRIDLPAGSLAGTPAVRYAAIGEDGRAVDCAPGRECVDGGAFPWPAVVRRGATGTAVLAAFESRAATPRGAALAVEPTQ